MNERQTEAQFLRLYDQLVHVRAQLAILKLVIHKIGPGIEKKISKRFDKEAPLLYEGMKQEIMKKDSATLPDEEERPRIIVPGGSSIVSGTHRGKA